MSKYYETPAFAALAKEWRRRLRESGFRDQETDREVLREQHAASRDRRMLRGHTGVGKGEYHTLASRWSNVRVFPSRLVKRLWELHAEGVGMHTAVTRLLPMVANARSRNQIILDQERTEFRRWLASPAMSGAELEAVDTSLWAQAMVADGWDPAGQTDPLGGYGRREMVWDYGERTG